MADPWIARRDPDGAVWVVEALERPDSLILSRRDQPTVTTICLFAEWMGWDPALSPKETSS